MKKIIIILIFIVAVNIITANNTNIKDMIRIRVIANSNNAHDQEIKNIISSNIKDTMYTLLKNTKDINTARNIIKTNINVIDNIIKEEINDEYEYNINYGMNYFPEKIYNGKTYKEGEYESLLVTLGKGEGDNWWCILFPPFCLIEVEESQKEVEYSFFLEELINNIFE